MSRHGGIERDMGSCAAPAGSAERYARSAVRYPWTFAQLSARRQRYGPSWVRYPLLRRRSSRPCLRYGQKVGGYGPKRLRYARQRHVSIGSAARYARSVQRYRRSATLDEGSVPCSGRSVAVSVYRAVRSTRSRSEFRTSPHGRLRSVAVGRRSVRELCLRIAYGDPSRAYRREGRACPARFRVNLQRRPGIPGPTPS
jgi:hypothetical protein